MASGRSGSLASNLRGGPIDNRARRGTVRVPSDRWVPAGRCNGTGGSDIGTNLRSTLRASLIVMACAALLVGAWTATAGAGARAPILAYTSERGGPLRVHVLGPGAGRHRVLAKSGFGMDVQPDWAPNGRWLAVSASDRDAQDFDIVLVSATGKSRRKLTSGVSWDEEPSWSPDGTRIAFASDRDGDFEIYVVDADGTNLRQLTDNRCEDTSPDWSGTAPVSCSRAVAAGSPRSGRCARTARRSAASSSANRRRPRGRRARTRSRSRPWTETTRTCSRSSRTAGGFGS